MLTQKRIVRDHGLEVLVLREQSFRARQRGRLLSFRFLRVFSFKRTCVCIKRTVARIQLTTRTRA
jgi:hypothetical protein